MVEVKELVKCSLCEELLEKGQYVSIVTDDTDFNLRIVGVIDLVNIDGVCIVNDDIEEFIPWEYIVDLKVTND